MTPPDRKYLFPILGLTTITVATAIILYSTTVHQWDWRWNILESNDTPDGPPDFIPPETGPMPDPKTMTDAELAEWLQQIRGEKERLNEKLDQLYKEEDETRGNGNWGLQDSAQARLGELERNEEAIRQEHIARGHNPKSWGF